MDRRLWGRECGYIYIITNLALIIPWAADGGCWHVGFVAFLTILLNRPHRSRRFIYFKALFSCKKHQGKIYKTQRVLVANLATNFWILVASTIVLAALATVLGAISCPESAWYQLSTRSQWKLHWCCRWRDCNSEALLGGRVFMSPVRISNLSTSQFRKVHTSLSEFRLKPQISIFETFKHRMFNVNAFS